jgi:hypothetical protein
MRPKEDEVGAGGVSLTATGWRTFDSLSGLVSLARGIGFEHLKGNATEGCGLLLKRRGRQKGLVGGEVVSQAARMF